jgi:hypothetical protein
MIKLSDKDSYSPDRRPLTGLRRLFTARCLFSQGPRPFCIDVEDWLVWCQELVLIQMVLAIFLLVFVHLMNGAPFQLELPTSGNVLWYTSPGVIWAKEYLPLGCSPSLKENSG